jgi:D-alanyl-D-alanine carboxypeptidase/D-alanyl-D-alanine-endopeptidase (penicillin-binding protein 4)
VAPNGCRGSSAAAAGKPTPSLWLALALGLLAGPSGELAARAEFAALLDDPGLLEAQVGLLVVRLRDGHVLLAHHADELLVPASNVKLITAAAALQQLTPDFQFKTEIYGRPNGHGVVPGNLGIKGFGDPYLVPERIYHLAGRLVVAGVRRIAGNLVVDDSYFTGDRLAYGWESDRSSNAYMAPMGALSASFNAVAVHVLPASRPGHPARIMLDPPSDYLGVVGKVHTVKAGPSQLVVDLRTSNQPPYDRVAVRGKLPQHASPRVFWRRIHSPPHYFGELLRRSLTQVGIRVDGKVLLGQVNPARQASPLLTFLSPRLAELLGPLNKHSNNFMAGQIALVLGAQAFGAPGSWPKGKAAIAAYLHDQLGLRPDAYRLGNASGLHEVNRFSPRQLVGVIKNMHDQPRLWPEFVSSLAVAGGLGTLQDRMQSGQAAGLVRAKTGTLAGASALSGVVVNRRGESLGFSMLVNGFVSVEGACRAQDRLGKALAEL